MKSIESNRIKAVTISIFAIVAISYLSLVAYWGAFSGAEYRRLTVSISQHGESTTVTVCNPTGKPIRFLDNLSLYFPDEPAYGVYDSVIKETDSINFFPPEVHFWLTDFLPKIRYATMEVHVCKTKSVSIVDQLLAKERITKTSLVKPAVRYMKFRVRVVLFENDYGQPYFLYRHKSYVSDWIDISDEMRVTGGNSHKVSEPL